MIEDLFELHDGRRERIRARIAAGGLDRLREHELLEYLLYYVIPRQDVNEIARDLLDYFGTLENVLNAEIPELAGVEGMGRKAAIWLAQIGECCIECGRTDANYLPLLDNFLRVFRYACRTYHTKRPPCSMQLCLTASSRLLYQREICESRAWGEPDTLREAMADVLNTGARNALIFQFVGDMHADPDEYDINHAREYAYALSLVDCTLTDVILVGDGGLTSMRQLDMVPNFRHGKPIGRVLCERYLENAPSAQELRVCDFSDTEDEDELFDI